MSLEAENVRQDFLVPRGIPRMVMNWVSITYGKGEMGKLYQIR